MVCGLSCPSKKFIYLFGCVKSLLRHAGLIAVGRLTYPMACGILVPQPGIEPVSPAVEAQSLNHWSTREVPGDSLLVSYLLFLAETVFSRKPSFFLLLEICGVFYFPSSPE